MERYEQPRIPVVITGLTDAWPATHAWTPAALRAEYGDHRFKVLDFFPNQNEEEGWQPKQVQVFVVSQRLDARRRCAPAAAGTVLRCSQTDIKIRQTQLLFTGSADERCLACPAAFSDQAPEMTLFPGFTRG